jgi:hypothetical protein
MLLLLIGTVTLSIFWFLIGRAFLTVVARGGDAALASIEWTMLVGAFVLAVLSQVVHFALPLRSTDSAAVVGVVFAVLAWVYRSDLRWLLDQAWSGVRRHQQLTIAFVAIAVVIAFSAARPCKVEDTENYHAQILRWTESASLVPGLKRWSMDVSGSTLMVSARSGPVVRISQYGPLPIVNTTTFVIGALYCFGRALHTTTRL